jgi:hypothetical protein
MKKQAYNSSYQVIIPLAEDYLTEQNDLLSCSRLSSYVVRKPFHSIMITSHAVRILPDTRGSA